MTDADFLQLTRVGYSVSSQEVWQVFQEQIIFGLSKITHSRPAPCFLATLVALHFTPVSKSLSKSLSGQSFELA